MINSKILKRRPGKTAPTAPSPVNFSFSQERAAGAEKVTIFIYLYNRKRDLPKILHKPQPG